MLLLRAAIMLAAVSVALRLVSFSRLKRICCVCTSTAIRDGSDYVPRVCHAVNAAAGVVPGSTCLARALAAQRILGSAGIATELRIGVVKAGESVLHAHSWLENEDRVIIGESSELRTYSRL
jgi:hypothetical protein